MRNIAIRFVQQAPLVLICASDIHIHLAGYTYLFSHKKSKPTTISVSVTNICWTANSMRIPPNPENSPYFGYFFEEIDYRFLERLLLNLFLIDYLHKIQVLGFAHKSFLIPDFEIMQINLWLEREFCRGYNENIRP